MDAEGSLLIVKGLLDGRLTTLVSMCQQNEFQLQTLEKFLLEIEQHKEGHLIVASDSNMALDPLVGTTRGISYISFARLKKDQKSTSSITLSGLSEIDPSYRHGL